MKIKKSSALSVAATMIALAGAMNPSLAQAVSQAKQCKGQACNESDLNAPVPGLFSEEDERPEVPNAYQTYSPPTYDTSWGLRWSLYKKAVAYYRSQEGRISNSRYLTIIDMSLHSSQKRFFLFDLATGTVEKHNVAHGEGSDPNEDGYATRFSNTNNSHMSSLGFYSTLGTYSGKNGYSMRLRGLESTNSNAEKRAVVVHPAAYVSDSASKAGFSWGCPAIDPKYSKSVIDRIKGGSVFMIED